MEYLDIVDENNILTGEKGERKQIHDENLWHRHVTSWIMNKKGEILLQKRAATKPRNPNRWAKTGGHVDSGESVEEAIQREVKEEIGIDVDKNQLQVIDVHKSRNPDNRYFAYNFIFVIDKKIEEFKLQEEEVSEVKYFSIEELENKKKNNDTNFTFAFWDNSDFEREMELLKQKRKEILSI